MTNRRITTWYEDVDGEREITVDVEQQDRFTAIVLDELGGVPMDEQQGVRDRAIEAYWVAERSAYLQSNPDAE